MTSKTLIAQMKAFRCHLFVTVVLLSLCCVLRCAAQQSTTNAAAQTNSIQIEMQAAIHQVEKIVNQPVTAYRRAPRMDVGRFVGGWFHAGATKPDFNTVDVRTTRETAAYDKYEYATSDLNTGIVWPAKQLEFNSMTKYFYTNRTVPKKRLTEAEMVEINRLYRIIGRGEQQLAQLRHPGAEPAGEATSDAASESSNSNDSASGAAKRPRLLNPYLGGGAILLLAAILFINYIRKK
jgi:hypothetical protein